MKEKRAENKLSGKQMAKTNTLLVSLMAVLAVVLLVNVILIAGINQKFGAAKELAKPANIEITTLKDSSCKDCSDLNPIISSIGKANVKITAQSDIDAGSSEGKSLIAKYGIKKLPTLIITGEIEKSGLSSSWSKFGVVKDNALVLTSISPPYLDLSTGAVRGLVSLTVLKDSSCAECSDVSAIVSQLKQAVKIVDEKTVDVGDVAGKKLISSYGIKKAPTILMSKEISDYDALASALPQLGTVESDGTFIMTKINPPYKEIDTGKIRGLVSIVFLNDSTCSKCYDVALHKKVLAQYGITASNQTTVDISTQEGKSLLAKYNITKVPTVIITGDVSIYDALAQVWAKVGSVESDGSYVFTNMNAIKGAEFEDLANKTAS